MCNKCNLKITWVCLRILICLSLVQARTRLSVAAKKEIFFYLGHVNVQYIEPFYQGLYAAYHMTHFHY